MRIGLNLDGCAWIRPDLDRMERIWSDLGLVYTDLMEFNGICWMRTDFDGFRKDLDGGGRRWTYWDGFAYEFLWFFAYLHAIRLIWTDLDGF